MLQLPRDLSTKFGSGSFSSKSPPRSAGLRHPLLFMSSELTRQWLRQNILIYSDKDRVYVDVDSVLGKFRSLRPKTDVYTFNDGRTQLLLCLHGLVPIVYRNAQYNIPIAIWITSDYPSKPPLVYVVPNSDLLIKSSSHVDLSGQTTIPYLDDWLRKSEGCNLIALVETLQDHFSREPPLYAKPRSAVSSTSVSAASPSSSYAGPSTYHATADPPTRPPKPAGASPSSPSSHYISSSGTSTPHSPPPPFVPAHMASTSSPAPPPLPPSLTSSRQQQHIPNSFTSQPTPPPPWGPVSYGQATAQTLPIPATTPAAQPQNLYPNVNVPYHIHPPPPQNSRQGSLPDTQQQHHVPPPQPKNLMDEIDTDPSQSASFPSAQSYAHVYVPPRPPNPELLALHAALHAKFTQSILTLHGTHTASTARLRALQQDLLSGEPAIRDEMARLEAVKDVCHSVVRRVGDVVRQAQNRVDELRRKGDPDVDEMICSTDVVYNQLIDLVAEDNALEDTVYHLHRALNAGRIDLEKFIRTSRALAEEQFMKRALIEKIVSASQSSGRGV